MDHRYTTALTPEGHLEIFELRPQRIATFADPELGRRFVAFLQGASEDAPEPTATTARVQVVVPFVTEEELLAEATRERDTAPGAPGTALVVAPSPAAPALRETVPEEVLDRAFRRIEAGEKLGAVAADMGVPYPVLRGHWAGHRSRQAKAEIEAGKERCGGCGTPFLPTVSEPHRCHRCRP